MSPERDDTSSATDDDLALPSLDEAMLRAVTRGQSPGPLLRCEDDCGAPVA